MSNYIGFSITINKLSFNKVIPFMFFRPGMNDEKEDQPTDSENNKAPMYSGGIPPSGI